MDEGKDRTDKMEETKIFRCIESGPQIFLEVHFLFNRNFAGSHKILKVLQKSVLTHLENPTTFL